MNKKLLRFLCTALMIVVCISVNAQTSGSCGANATWEYDNGTLTISGTGAMADYTDDLTEAPWHAYRTAITEVVIGSNITRVGRFAFCGCTALTSVTIGDHVESIGGCAFDNCTNAGFISLNIPNSVQSIESCAFSNNHLLTVSLGTGLTEIWQEAFMQCTDLKYIACYATTPPTIANANAFSGVTPTAIYVPTASIATYQAATNWNAFSTKIQGPGGICGENNGTLTDAVKWSFNETTATLTLTGTGTIKTFSDQGPMAYPWCDYDGSGNHKGMEDITTIVIDEGITNIPDYAFAMYEYCTSVTLPSTLTSIGASSLEECGFTSITLPEGLETIGDYAFLASKFSSITLPSTLTTIGGSAFNDCESLTSITIPANVTSIGESAFQNCIALKAVEILRATPPTIGNLALYDYSDPPVVIPALTAIYVPAASVNDYKNAAGWSEYDALIQKQNSTIVGDYHWTTFYDVSNSYEVDANTTVYKAALSGTTLTTTPIGGNQIITAGNAVILKSTSIPVLSTTATASTGDFSDNSLHGSDGSATSDGTYYALACKDSKLAFFKVKSGQSIPAGKAYVINTSGAPSYLEIITGNETTSIGDVKCKKDTINGFYDLQGRRVTQPTKGLYIVNGKKVIIK